MTPPITYEQALEKARRLYNNSWGIQGNLDAIARLAIESALAEASDEVCVCGHRRLEHKGGIVLTEPAGECFCKSCVQFLSRSAFLERELEEHK